MNTLDVINQSGIEPREYQIRIVDSVINNLNNGIKSIIITSPTGSGKTIIGLIILKRLEELYSGISFGWVAMRRKLLKQVAKENHRVGVRNIKYFSMFEKNPPKTQLLILDEVHHAAANSYLELLNAADPTFSLGLTGTPFRTDKIKLPYQKVISDYGVRFLIEQGYLSHFEQYLIPKWTPELIAKVFLNEPKRFGKSIIFMKDTVECNRLFELLNRQIKCSTIFGEDSEEKREEIYNKFEKNELQVLINVNLLVEGFDCPDLQSVWVRDNCKLPTMQMAGRVLRKDPDNPNKIAQIIQSEKTPFSYARVIKPKQTYILQDKFRPLCGTDETARIASTVKIRMATKGNE